MDGRSLSDAIGAAFWATLLFGIGAGIALVIVGSWLWRHLSVGWR